jgi:hypothetical protein
LGFKLSVQQIMSQQELVVQQRLALWPLLEQQL